MTRAGAMVTTARAAEGGMSVKSRKYLLTYCYENTDRTIGIGSITMTQSQYYPINQEVLDDAIKFVRRDICLPNSQKIVPLAFIRFEAEVGE